MKISIFKKRILILLIIVAVLCVGVAIPKLTVSDTVEVDKEFKTAVMQAVNHHYDNPLESLALMLGKSRIVKASELNAEIESFTIFRIPLGFFSGASDMRLAIHLNPVSNKSTEYTSDLNDSIATTSTSNANQEDNIIQEDNELWQSFTNKKQNIEFKYPKDLSAKYISTVKWPPTVTIQDTKQLECVETPAENSLSKWTVRRQVDNRIYCVSAVSEGAAGSVYTQYSYLGIWNEKIVKVSFTLQYPQCYNYSEPQQSECIKEREAFDLDGLVDRIFTSLKYLNS